MRPFSDVLRDPGEQLERRSHEAFLAQLISPRWVNAAILRGAIVAAYTVVLLAQMRTHTTSDAPVPWLGIGVAGLGTFLSWRLAHTSLDLRSIPGVARGQATLDQLLAAGPIPAPLARYVLLDFRRSARAVLNLSGVLEFIGAGFLGAGLHYYTDPRLALVACALGVAYIWSACMNMCVYQAWYAPLEHTSSALEWLRVLIGPLGVLVAAVFAVPAFEGDWRWAAAGLCVSMLALGPRVRQTDQLLAALSDVADASFLRGRADITVHLHSHPVQTMEILENQLALRRDLDREVYDQVRIANGELRHVLALDLSSQLTLQWPEVLKARASRLAVEGFILTMDVPPGPVISAIDRQIGSLVLHEFTQNAKKAGGMNMHAKMTRDGYNWTLELTDDGVAIDPTAFHGSMLGLHRLRTVMVQQSGTITLQGPKTVMATWVATEVSHGS